jgi:hypothetical protein
MSMTYLPTMAMAIYIACTYIVAQLLSYVGNWAGVAGLVSWQMLVPVAASGAFWRLRRQAVL